MAKLRFRGIFMVFCGFQDNRDTVLSDTIKVTFEVIFGPVLWEEVT
jgi:hypothetical protein